MEYSDIGLFEEEKCQVTTNQSSTVQSELRSTNQHSEEILKKNAYHHGANIEQDERELKKGDCKCIYNVG